MSKLSYLIILWVGCGTVLRKSLQVIQNQAARLVTRLGWYTPKTRATATMWMVQCKSTDILPFSPPGLQSEAEQVSPVPTQDAPRVQLPVQDKAG